MRIFLRILGILVLLLIVTVASVWIFRVSLAQEAARLALDRAGLTDIRFRLTDVGLAGAGLTELDLGPNQPRIDSLRVEYTIPGLIGQRIDSIVIDGVRYERSLAPQPAAAQGTDTPGASDTAPWLARIIEILENLNVVIRLTNADVTLHDLPTLDTVRLGGLAILDFREQPGQVEVDLRRLPLLEAQSASQSTGSELAPFAWRAAGTAAQGRLRLEGVADLGLEGLSLSGWRLEAARYEGPLALDLGSSDLAVSGSAPLHVSARDGAGPQRVEGAVDKPRLALDWSPGGINSITISDSRVSLPASGLELAGLAATIPFSGQGLAGSADVRSRVTQTGPDALLTSLEHSLTLSAQGGMDRPVADRPVADRPVTDRPVRDHQVRAPQATTTKGTDAGGQGQGVIMLRGRIALPKGAGSLPLQGRYDTADGSGQGRLGPVTLNFTENGLQPADLSPRLSSVRDVRGALALEASLRRSKAGGLRTTAVLNFRDVDLELPTSTVLEGLSGQLNLVSAKTIGTPGIQTLTARRIASPFPLDKPQVRFDLTLAPEGPVITVHEARGGFAGGTVRLAPFTYRASETDRDLTITLEALSLGQLLDDWAADRVKGSGVLTGAVPVRLTREGAIIADGKVTAEGPGTLQVQWGEARAGLMAQGNEVGLMVRALEDFRYDTLKVNVARPSEGDLAFAITLGGHNPAVLDSQPFIFNITLSGNLEELLGALSAGQGLTTDLLRGRLGR